jgi:hypothetical protein
MKYQLPYPRKGFEKNYEIAQELMNSFEYSGVFSETLLNKIFKLLIQCTEVVSYDDSKDKNIFNLKNGSSKGTKQEYLTEKWEEFQQIFDCYCIFSDKFKGYCTAMFLTLIRIDLK